MRLERLSFRAMGTDVSLIAHGCSPGALDRARALVARCERRWSRFVPTSELEQLNARAGAPVVMPPDTYALVAGAVDGWRLTGGRFDPTVLAAVRASGYDRSFEQLSAPRGGPAVASAGCGAVVLDDELHAVTLPAGVGLDLGGIAKGHTADLVVAALVEDGADGAVADIGGDIRAVGDWNIAVEGPDDSALAVLRVADGAVVTSSTQRRRWRGRDGTVRHHLIDPATGGSATSGLAQATVVARTASTAEVLATAAVIAGRSDAVDLVLAAGATGLLVDNDGTVWRLPGLEDLVA